MRKRSEKKYNTERIIIKLESFSLFLYYDAVHVLQCARATAIIIRSTVANIWLEGIISITPFSLFL